METPTIELDDLPQWVEGLFGRRRVMLGIAGPPGAGKSTVANYLATRFGAPVVGMDGFHLAMRVIEAEGWLERKGAPHTFDGHGFVSLLARLRSQGGETVYAPVYDRAAKNPIGSAVPVQPDDRLIIVEGNYLLLDASPWDQVATILDRCVYVELDDDARIRRLIKRHIEHGKEPNYATSFVMESDEANAELVIASKAAADLIVRVS